MILKPVIAQAPGDCWTFYLRGFYLTFRGPIFLSFAVCPVYLLIYNSGWLETKAVCYITDEVSTMKTTMKDIARELDISVTAVSKSLNDADDISPDLKRRVRQKARELNYYRDHVARKLASPRTYTLGAFMFSRSTKVIDISYKFLNGVLEEANDSRYDIILFSLDAGLLEEKSCIELCRERQVEGAIFTGLTGDHPQLDEIRKSELPTAVIDTRVKGENNYFISSNNEGGVRLGMQYLWQELGHRNIALLTGPPETYVMQQRWQGYKEFLSEKGGYEEDLVFHGDFSRESGYSQGADIASLPADRRPTAIFALSDVLAAGASRAVQEAGLKVPEDISILGFDDVAICEFVDPALTTIGQNADSVGRAAARAIIDHLQGDPPDGDGIFIDVELVKRESCFYLTKKK